MDNNFEPLEQGDAVVSVHPDKVAFALHPLFKVQMFQEKVKSLLKQHASNKATEWLDDAIVAEILKPGGQWEKGKIRIKVTLEFQLDEELIRAVPPESPLDDIRRTMQ